MKSYLNIRDKWVKVTPQYSRLEGLSTTIKSDRILNLMKTLGKVNCSEDYNLLIQKLKGIQFNHSNNALGIVTDYCLSSQMAENIFPILSRVTHPQLYFFANNKPGLLICFCGKANQLNIPLLVFHATYSQLFGGIAYFFMDNDHILRKIGSIPAITPFCDKLSFLGTSGGAHIPLVLKTKYPNSTALSFSPAHYDDFNKYGLGKQAFDSNWSNNCRVYYSSVFPKDRYFADYFKTLVNGKIFSDVFIDISGLNPSHATLTTLFRRNLLDRVMIQLSNHAL